MQPFEAGVAIEVTVEDASPGKRPRIRGETNLPDGTELNVIVTEPDAYGRTYSRICKVAGGRYAAERAWFEEGLVEGEYAAEVLMLAPETQSKSVQAIVGARGEHLKGPLVTHRFSTFGAETRRSFVVGDDPQKAIAVGRARREATRKRLFDTRATLKAIEERGRAATHEPTAECKARSKREQEELDRIHQELKGLAFTVPGREALSDALGELHGCVSCEIDYPGGCDAADIALTRVESELATPVK